MSYTLKLQGALALNTVSGGEQVDYELIFDHLTIEADGLSAEEVANAVAAAIRKSMVGRRPVDSIEAAYPYAADEQALLWLRALVQAKEAMAADEANDAARVLARAKLSPVMSSQEITLAIKHLHEFGELPPYAVAAGADR